MNEFITPGIPDSMFIRGDVPITKEEVRAIAVSKLRLTGESRILDIGAGTGSVTVECAGIAKKGFVYAVEKNSKALELIHQNIEKFNAENVLVREGYAPEALDSSWKFDRAFIGGSGGNLEEILNWIENHISGDGNIVVTSVTMNTLARAWEFFRKKGYEHEIVQASVTRCEDTGSFTMFRAQNPVFIISARRKR